MHPCTCRQVSCRIQYVAGAPNLLGERVQEHDQIGGLRVILLEPEEQHATEPLDQLRVEAHPLIG